MDSKKLLIVIVIVATIILGAIGSVGFILWQRQQPHTPATTASKEEPVKKEPPGPPILFEVKDLLCMLNEPVGESVLLSLSINLDLKEEKDKEEMKNYLPIIIDTFLQTCNSMTSAQISGPKGQVAFKTEVQKRLNAEFKKRTDKEPIRDILYNNYIISTVS